MVKGTLFDANLCEGCEACFEACQEANGLSGELERLSAESYCTLNERGDYYQRRMCMHCIEPSCASVCPVKALHRLDDGPVVYDYEKCIGCRYCMVACPFAVPRYEWDERLPRVRKCEMCKDRLAAGGETACSEACEVEATVFGERDELLALARKRIAEDPGYYSPRIVGEHEAGGTAVLIIGPPSVIDALYGDVPLEALPEKTWAVLSKIPGIVSVAGVSLLGMHWIVRRKRTLADEADAARAATRASAPARTREDEEVVS